MKIFTKAPPGQSEEKK